MRLHGACPYEGRRAGADTRKRHSAVAAISGTRRGKKVGFPFCGGTLLVVVPGTVRKVPQQQGQPTSTPRSHVPHLAGHCGWPITCPHRRSARCPNEDLLSISSHLRAIHWPCTARVLPHLPRWLLLASPRPPSFRTLQAFLEGPDRPSARRRSAEFSPVVLPLHSRPPVPTSDTY